MPEYDPRLDALTRAATAALGPAKDAPRGDPFWGSGCFVAPGWLLTCAHVLKTALRGDFCAEFTVTVEGGKELPARLAYWLPGAVESSSPPVESDLALIRLLEGAGEHECVWLTDCGDPPVGEVKAYGWYMRPTSGTGAVTWNGNCRVSGADGRCGVTLSPDTEIPPGASGGPVVDTARGSVVGFVKARRVERDGGLAVGVTALREFATAEAVDPADLLGPNPYRSLLQAHDRWHAAQPSDGWGDVQDGLTGGDLRTDPAHWSPEDRLTALRMLADLPDQGEPPVVRALVRETLYEHGRWTGPDPHMWRDGHGQLYNHRQSVTALPYLRFAKLAALACQDADNDAVDTMLCWVETRARHLPDDSKGQLKRLELPAELPVSVGTAQSAGAGQPVTVTGIAEGPSILLTLTSVMWQTAPRFYWEIRMDLGDGTSVPLEGEEDDRVGPEELPARLERPLNRAFLRADTHDRAAPLEVSLPAEYFDMPVQHWLPQPADGTPLGARRQVTVRDQERRTEAEGPWLERWRRATGAERLRALRSPPLGRTLRSEQLTSAEGDQIPVMCWPASYGIGRASVDLALDAGHGIVLWHTRTHPGYGCEDSCQLLHDRTAELLTSVRVQALPEQLRILREQVHRQAEGAQWAAELALLYDDPGRPLPAMAGTLDSP